MATMSEWGAELEPGQFTCVTCGRASDPHDLDGMEECEACIPSDEAADARRLLAEPSEEQS